MSDDVDARVAAWLDALEARYLADLTVPEVARALRALSSCYVERRARLAEGGALGSAGKRAAFALFYAPLHLVIIRHIVGALVLRTAIDHVHDLGCGTGSAGAAWALEADSARVSGVDRHPWAVAEANWTYRQLRLPGRAVQSDIRRVQIASRKRTAILAAYAVNELPDPIRPRLLARLLAWGAQGASILIVEPIARRLTPWWTGWETAILAAGGASNEWRFEAPLRARQRELGRAAGLNLRELTARSLSLTPHHGGGSNKPAK